MEVKMLYKTPYMAIGKSFWRMVVLTHDIYGAVTEYQFCTPPKAGTGHFSVWDDAFWKSEKLWKGYSTHKDGYGEPKTVTKLYWNHALNIDRALLAGMEALLAEWDKAGKTGLQVDDLRAEVRSFKMSSRFGRNTA
jgi:hypothetical protein